MEQQQAIEILVKVAFLAQSKGILTLDEAVVVKQAIETFVKKEDLEEIKDDKE